MAAKTENEIINKNKIIPWWENSKTYKKMWHGSLFDRMILAGDDEGEQRIQRLRNKALERPQGKRGYVSVWRAKLLTDSYHQTEGEAAIIRKAKGFKNICEFIPIPYEEDQLLMGSAQAVLSGTEVEPEFMTSWLSRNVYCEEVNDVISEVDALKIRGVDSWIISKEDEKILREYVLPYWKNICHEAVFQKQLKENFPEVPFEDGQLITKTSYPLLGSAMHHTAADYATVLRKGLKAVKTEIQDEIDKIDGSDIPSSSDFDRKNVYKAMLISADAIITYANRCAEIAKEKASSENDPKRKEELLEMSRICYKVPEFPAESWWEAVQSWHLLHNAVRLCEGGTSHSAGRFDQYMYPYLKGDLENNRITRKRAQELLECLFIKIRQMFYLIHYRSAKRVQSNRTNDKLTYSGVDSYGKDATNELSFMILEAHCHVHLDDPNLAFRVHRDTPDDILKATLEALRLGTGTPHIINDEAIVSAFLNRGVPLKDARNYCDIGCQENLVDPNTSPGVDVNGRTNGGYFNLPKMVEFVLYNGIDKFSGKQYGLKTGDPRNFVSMDEFFEAVKKQIEYGVYHSCICNNLMDWAFSRYHPVPVVDLLHPGPRKKGIDFTDGGCKYNWTGAVMVGLGTATDALAAIAWLVYDKKEVTMEQLLKALENNWEGYENIRQKCLQAPKFGNDDDYADNWMSKLSNAWMDEYEKHKTAHGGTFVPGSYSLTAYVAIGGQTWATPDGRKKGEPISSATDPSNGVDLEGPTSLHKSASKIDTSRTVNGIAFNCKFTAAAVADERGLSKWADLVRTYILLKGQAVQYNIIDGESLKNAQKHPEEYKDLIVRTGGFSAFFVELNKETQDTIIARTEHQF